MCVCVSDVIFKDHLGTSKLTYQDSQWQLLSLFLFLLQILSWKLLLLLNAQSENIMKMLKEQLVRSDW